MAHYPDTSAFLELLVSGPETLALREWPAAHDGDLVGSELVMIEALRAARRHSPDALAAARARLGLLNLWCVTAAVCRRADELGPAGLRTLDAVHLATALELGTALQGLVTYDVRLAEAGAHHGVAVLAP